MSFCYCPEHQGNSVEQRSPCTRTSRERFARGPVAGIGSLGYVCNLLPLDRSHQEFPSTKRCIPHPELDTQGGRSLRDVQKLFPMPGSSVSEQNRTGVLCSGVSRRMSTRSSAMRTCWPGPLFETCCFLSFQCEQQSPQPLNIPEMIWGPNHDLECIP